MAEDVSIDKREPVEPSSGKQYPDEEISIDHYREGIDDQNSIQNRYNLKDATIDKKLETDTKKAEWEENIITRSTKRKREDLD